METKKMGSIGHLQETMKRQLKKMGSFKAMSVDFRSSFKQNKADDKKGEPQRISIKSYSSRKRDTSITISTYSPILVRQTSMEVIGMEENQQAKGLKKTKLKKKLTNKGKVNTFKKLKRGETLPDQFMGLIESCSSIEQIYAQKVEEKKQKTAQQYEGIISKQRDMIKKLEEIIQSM